MTQLINNGIVKVMNEQKHLNEVIINREYSRGLRQILPSELNLGN